MLGQAKRGIVLDLKKPEAVEIARALAAQSDVLVENFATGVMDRLGLGAEALRAINPNLIYVSASGLGRTGPESHAVAYGTLLQCYAGFAGLNRHPDIAPRVGFAWLDPMCGLMLAFVTAAALWRRRRDGGCGADRFLDDRGDAVDDGRAAAGERSLALRRSRGAIVPPATFRTARIAAPETTTGSASPSAATRNGEACAPSFLAWHGWPTSGSHERVHQRATIDDALCAWFRSQRADTAAAMLLRAGIPAASLANSVDLVASSHLAGTRILGTARRRCSPRPAMARQLWPDDPAPRRISARTPTRFCATCSICRTTRSMRCVDRARWDSFARHGREKQKCSPSPCGRGVGRGRSPKPGLALIRQHCLAMMRPLPDPSRKGR